MDKKAEYDLMRKRLSAMHDTTFSDGAPAAIAEFLGGRPVSALELADAMRSYDDLNAFVWWVERVEETKASGEYQMPLPFRNSPEEPERPSGFDREASHAHTAR